MSYTVQRALPMRPAALTVAALHAGIVVVLLTSITAPYGDPPAGPMQWTPVQPDPLPVEDKIDLKRPTHFEVAKPRETAPTLKVADEVVTEREPTTIDPPVSGNAGMSAQLEWSRAEILGSHEVAYPASSIRNDEQGVVLLKVRVGIDGRPREVEVDKSSGFASLDQAALRAVTRWRFKPPMRGGLPVEMWTRVPISFQLKN